MDNSNIKILIVDDKVENLVSLEILLDDLNVEFVRAQSGNEALEKTLEHEFALALVDVQMPEMDGFETVRLMRQVKKTKYLPVIFVSAIYSDEYYKIKGIESGAVDFIAKPIVPEILRGKVNIFQDLYKQKKNLEGEIELRKKTEKELIISEKKYHGLFDGIPAGLYQTSEEGKFLVVNEAFAKILGYNNKEEVLKESASKFYINEKDRVKWSKDIQKFGVVQNFETKIRRVDGKEIWIQDNARAVKDSNENLLYYEGSTLDETQRKEAEDALKKSEEELRKANQTKDKLFSVVSHDLRGPVGNLNHFLEELVDHPDLFSKEEAEEILKLLKISASSTFNLLENLLSWARNQTGEIKYKPEKIQLSEIVFENVTLLENNAKLKNIKLSSNVSEDLMVKADKNMILTVVRNLISNAIKFTNDDGKVDLTAKANRKDVELTVADTGVGMDEEVAKIIFDPYSGHSTRGTKGEKGTGLGLNLCKEFVEKNGGKIWVESKVGEGSKFKFTLPKA